MVPMYSREGPDSEITLVGVAKINVEASEGTFDLKPWNQITFGSSQFKSVVLLLSKPLN